MANACQRSIPACAGEAPPLPTASVEAAVYPRVCGGSQRIGGIGAILMGLSPRVRGKLVAVALDDNTSGSIPACAGEARPQRKAAAKEEVYPRVCGGSPVLGVNGKGRRSIPACAGEASSGFTPFCKIRVYPRVCGGSKRHLPRPLDRLGLSPRVRGKLSYQQEGQLTSGSIPACAGEAGRPACWKSPTGVYPRVCGGSITARGRLLAK